MKQNIDFITFHKFASVDPVYTYYTQYMLTHLKARTEVMLTSTRGHGSVTVA